MHTRRGPSTASTGQHNLTPRSPEALRLVEPVADAQHLAVLCLGRQCHLHHRLGLRLIRLGGACVQGRGMQGISNTFWALQWASTETASLRLRSQQ